MDAAPGVMMRVRAWILTKRPNDKFISIWRSYKNVGVVTIKTALCFYTTQPAIIEIYFKIMALSIADILITLNHALLLQ